MKKLISILLIAITLISLCGCSKDVPKNAVFSPEDLQNKKAGILTDTPTHCYFSKFQEMGINVISYTDSNVILNDVASGSLDCAIMDEKLAKDETSPFAKTKILDTPVLSEDFSIITALESVSLLSIIDSTLGTLIEEGIVKDITKNYFSDKEYIYTSPEDIQYSATLTLAVNAIGKPFAYYDENNQLVGMDIDIARAICDRMGVELSVVDADGSNLYDFIRSGRADFAMGCLAKTEETQDIVGFSQSYYTCTQVIIVRKK